MAAAQGLTWRKLRILFPDLVEPLSSDALHGSAHQRILQQSPLVMAALAMGHQAWLAYQTAQRLVNIGNFIIGIT